MKLHYFIAAAAVTGLMAGSAFAQSAKFAASWDNDVKIAYAMSECDSDPLTVAIPDCPADLGGSGLVEDMLREMEMAQLHISQDKEIFIGVGAQIGIMLITEAKGKNGQGSTAMAQGGVDVQLTLVNEDGETCDVIAPDDNVTLMMEMRKLSVNASSTADDIEVFVGIETNSVAATHFEFLGVDCPQGTYTLTAYFDLSALADVAGYAAVAEAEVTLGNRMITLQEVRAVKGSLVSDSD